MTTWAIVRWLHLLAMAFFVGGQLVLVAAVVPALRGDADRERLRAVARRFGWGSLVALAVLLATGSAMAGHFARWGDGTLHVKLGLVAVAGLLVAVAHAPPAAALDRGTGLRRVAGDRLARRRAGPRRVIMRVRIKRVYEPPAPGDGYRVLVDRIWPSGDDPRAGGDRRAARQLGPSDELRRWYGHDPARFDAFAARYKAELAAHRDELAALRRRARAGTVTLIFSARDAQRSQAAVLAGVLGSGLR